MSASTAQIALTQHFEQVWAGRTPFFFVGGPGPDANDGQWVRFSVKTIKPYQREVGGDLVKIYTPGILWVQCFAPLDDGKGAALEVAEQAELIYFNLKLPGFEWFDLPEVADIGETPDGKWYQVNCECNFRAVETRTRT